MAVRTFDDALRLDPHNVEIKRERDEAARKARALELKQEGETFMGNHDYEQTTLTVALKYHGPSSGPVVTKEEPKARLMPILKLPRKGERDVQLW